MDLVVHVSDRADVQDVLLQLDSRRLVGGPDRERRFFRQRHGLFVDGDDASARFREIFFALLPYAAMAPIAGSADADDLVFRWVQPELTAKVA